MPDELNHSLNVVHPLCLISLEFIRRGLFCWLHSALLPHSGPFNRILPGIEFSFEHRGSKPHLSFFFFFFFPQQICAHFKTNARGERRPTLPWRNKQRACSGFSLIARAERLVLKKKIFLLINVASIDTKHLFFKKSISKKHKVELCNVQQVLLQCATYISVHLQFSPSFLMVCVTVKGAVSHGDILKVRGSPALKSCCSRGRQ